MIKLLIIADDFTGALDTGVQFSAAGADVRVITDQHYDFSKADVDVLVLDSETRHISAESAYQLVSEVVKRAVSAGIPHIYKKTDSALRGNIGAELQAVLDASGEQKLPFLPAFPRMKRLTKNGIHYIDGVKVEDSVFGKDPFEPVTRSEVSGIIGLQSKAKVRVIPEGRGAGAEDREKEICVFDISSEQSLKEAAELLKKEGKVRILAGCAGLASVLPELLELKHPNKPVHVEKNGGFLVACGSVNPITQKQLDCGEKNGFVRRCLTPMQKLEQGYWKTEEGEQTLKRIAEESLQSPRYILDTNDLPGSKATREYADQQGITLEELRKRITESLGYAVMKIMDSGNSSTLMIMGGDTLLGFLNQISVSEMQPVCELLPGTVLSSFVRNNQRYQIISKSGGFGGETLLLELSDMILNHG